MSSLDNMAQYPFKGQVYGPTPLTGNCSSAAGMQVNFEYYNPNNLTGGAVELTNYGNSTQIGSFPTPGFTFDDLPPSEDLLPYAGDAGTVFRTEAFYSKCWNRSIPLTASLYPTPGLTQEGDPVPPEGNVNVVLTNQCAEYTWKPAENETSVQNFLMKDPWGNTYAMQSSLTYANSSAGFEANADAAVLPDGWTIEKTNLTETEMHYSYMIGDDCWLIVLKDSAGNAWHQYIYGEPLEQSTLLNSLNCSFTVPANSPTYSPGGSPSHSPQAPSSLAQSTAVLGGEVSVMLYFMLLMLSLLTFWRH
ncbi:hypothetical protein M9435_003555 [Picochlorum sp. BPE23]|nr:hypothetical protein M9435_003555 [Picochlorum sp. BPE23]